MRKITIEIGGKEFYNTVKHIEDARIKANKEMKEESLEGNQVQERWAFHLLKNKISIDEYNDFLYTLMSDEMANLLTFTVRSQNELGKQVTSFLER